MIFLDANSTSRLRPLPAQVLLDATAENLPLNPSSVHALGRRGRAELRAAREEIISTLLPKLSAEFELIFTSGGSESCNLIVRGLLDSCERSPGEVIASRIEHVSVLKALEEQEREQGRVSWVLPERNGIMAVSSFLQALSKNTKLVTLMAANNETGATQPLEELCLRLRELGYRGYIVSDISQALGKYVLDLCSLFKAGLDAVAFSSHKLGGPHGMGAVIVRRKLIDDGSFMPIIVGGTQENGLRAGTENVIAAKAFAAAVSEVISKCGVEVSRRSELRDLLYELIRERHETVCLSPGVSSPFDLSLCNTMLLRFPGIRGDDLVAAFDLEGLCVSSGSACSSGKQGVSETLLAMGLSDIEAREAVRFSLDWDMTESMVYQVAEVVSRVLARFTAREGS